MLAFLTSALNLRLTSKTSRMTVRSMSIVQSVVLLFHDSLCLGVEEGTQLIDELCNFVLKLCNFCPYSHCRMVGDTGQEI